MGSGWVDGVRGWRPGVPALDDPGVGGLGRCAVVLERSPVLYEGSNETVGGSCRVVPARGGSAPHRERGHPLAPTRQPDQRFTPAFGDVQRCRGRTCPREGSSLAKGLRDTFPPAVRDTMYDPRHQYLLCGSSAALIACGWCLRVELAHVESASSGAGGAAAGSTLATWFSMTDAAGCHPVPSGADRCRSRRNVTLDARTQCEESVVLGTVHGERVNDGRRRIGGGSRPPPAHRTPDPPARTRAAWRRSARSTRRARQTPSCTSRKSSLSRGAMGMRLARRVHGCYVT
jgi:hypothetical protein